jgi:uncharacterized protein YjiS (DUF1127 family)
MTMLNNTSNTSVNAFAFRRSARFFIVRLARLLNGWVAAAIAERERHAQLTVLRTFSDRDLKDVGLNRCQIGEGLAEASKDRSRCQPSRK